MALLSLTTIVGCLLVYLTAKHQSILDKKLPIRPWRFGGWALILLALAGGTNAFGIGSALLTWSVLLMLTFGSLPFVTLLFNKRFAEQKERR